MSDNNEVCIFFLRGECFYGASCHFLHPQEAITSTNENVQKQFHSMKPSFGSGNQFSGIPDASTGQSKQAQTCWYILENGWCQYGDNCRYSHDIPANWLRNPPSKSVCVYFQRGTCRRGDNCNFLHPTVGNNDTNYAVASDSYVPMKQVDKQMRKKERRNKKVNSTDEVENTKQKKEISYVADKQESCSELGDKVSELSITTSQELNNVSSKVPQVIRRPVVHPRKGPKLSELSEEDVNKLEQQERELVLKRIEPTRLIVQKEDGLETGKDQYHIAFASSDPDWGYDVTDLPLIVKFPSGYPKYPMQVSVEDDDTLPAVLIQHCATSITNWISEQHSVAVSEDQVWLCFREFLRWLDRNLEEIFTQGLKKYQRQLQAAEAGLEFISAEQLRDKYRGAAASDRNGSDDDVGDDDEPYSDDEDDEDDDQAAADDKEEAVSSSEPARRGTELFLRGLELKEQVGTLRLSRGRVQLRCQRCRQPQDIDLPGSGTLRTLACDKCGAAMSSRLRAGCMHLQNAVAGYLDLKGCTSDDLLLPDCQFLVGCLSCSREAALLGLAAGTLRTQWCQFCHAKQEIQLHSARFTALPGPSLPIESAATGLSTELSAPRRRRREPRDPLIQEGQPLPDQGKCRHYRKSYRWLRFPCCGKAFPCDVCHDDATTDGHEMAFATRMLCGHCAREQPYSAVRPCVACHKSLTRTASTHWEGGKGCRDSKIMSTKDSHKFHSLNKTVSRRAFSKSGGGKRKAKSSSAANTSNVS